jgi:hypothetical protein
MVAGSVLGERMSKAPPVPRMMIAVDADIVRRVNKAAAQLTYAFGGEVISQREVSTALLNEALKWMDEEQTIHWVKELIDKRRASRGGSTP